MVILLSIGVIPEINRHGRKRLAAHQFALLIDNFITKLVKGFDIHGQTPTLQLTGIDRTHGISKREATIDVRAAGDGGQLQVRLNLTVNKLEVFNRQRRAGGKHRPQRRQIICLAGFDARILQGGNVTGAGAENGYFFILGHFPQSARVGMKGIAVIQNQRGPDGQGTGQPVPHHPAAGGKVKNRVVAFQIGVQYQFFEMMNQDAATTLHHALGQPRGARRIHDIQGMLKRQLFKFDLQPGLRGQKLPVVHGFGDPGDVRILLGVRHHDHFLNRRQLF